MVRNTFWLALPVVTLSLAWGQMQMSEAQAIPAVESIAATSALTGIAAVAPTAAPSRLTGRKPALGWNTWNAYYCNISEAKVLLAAEQFISLGLREAGYRYINVDDCWALRNRSTITNEIVPDPDKFPNGIEGVVRVVHELGLKFGIYSDAGLQTCQKYPGSLGYELIDAATFNRWGVDYLKYDNCYVPQNWTDDPAPPNNDWYNSNSAIRYRQMTAALAAQERPIQFSICIWGFANVWTWGKRVGHSWRVTGDSQPTWDFISSTLSNVVRISNYTTFYGHNDMDMIEISNGNLTIFEQRTQFAAWVMMKSPILLGTDLGLLNSTQLAIIKNKELLAYHQDNEQGGSATPFLPHAGANMTDPPEFYVGLSSVGRHVFIINTSPMEQAMSFELALVPGLDIEGTYLVHDMWAGRDVGVYGKFGISKNFSLHLVSHDTAAYRITGGR